MDEEPVNPESENATSDPNPMDSRMNQNQEEVTVLSRGGSSHTFGSDNVRSFDFDGTSFLTPQEMRKLKQIHENFVRNLTARLSLYLRIEIDMELEDLESTTMRSGLNEMSENTHLSLVRMTPLRGHSVVEIPLPMSLSIVDRLLGGPAQLQDADGKLNDVEISLLDDVLAIISSEWSNIWSHVMPIQPAVVSHESNPKYLCSSSLDSAALQITIKTTIGDCKESIRLVIPHLTLEPLVGSLSKVDLDSDDTESTNQTQKPNWCDRFDAVPVHLSTWCRGPKISLKDMSCLNVGQFLPFHSAFFNTAVLKVAGKEAFNGNVGKVNEQWAFKIAQNLKN